jgi:hypothetical protein
VFSEIIWHNAARQGQFQSGRTGNPLHVHPQNVHLRAKDSPLKRMAFGTRHSHACMQLLFGLALVAQF